MRECVVLFRSPAVPATGGRQRVGAPSEPLPQYHADISRLFFSFVFRTLYGTTLSGFFICITKRTRVTANGQIRPMCPGPEDCNLKLFQRHVILRYSWSDSESGRARPSPDVPALPPRQRLQVSLVDSVPAEAEHRRGTVPERPLRRSMRR